MLKAGDKAPNFQAVSDEGAVVSLSDYLANGPVVLYFYPKDNSPGCTTEAISFRENWAKIKELGADVIGVSSDNIQSHKEFKSSCSLPFTLVSDPGQKIRKLYGVTGMLIPPRVTFVIDGNGIIRDAFNSQLMVKNHVKRALEVLAAMRDEKQSVM